jgi:hypothetical protein
MADDDDALEGLRNELEKLSRRIDDLDRKLIVLRGRNPRNCRVCGANDPRKAGDPPISDVGQKHHDDGHPFA